MTATIKKNYQTPTNCLLCDSGCADRQGKAESFCRYCGWDVNECRRRKYMIQHEGLQQDEHGYKRLIIRYDDTQQFS